MVFTMLGYYPISRLTVKALSYTMPLLKFIKEESMDPKEYFRELGRKGGKARMENTTPKERQEIAKKGQKALRKKIAELKNKA
jgi:hypothetical protein